MTLCLFSRFRRMSSQHIATLKITYWTALSDTKPVDRLRVLLRDRSHPVIDGRAACDFAFGLSRLLLLCVRRLSRRWRRSEEQRRPLGEVSG